MPRITDDINNKKARRDIPNVRRDTEPKPSKIKTIKTKPQKRRNTAHRAREQEPELRVIKGGAGKKKIRRIITLVTVLAIIAAVLFANNRAPGGLIEWSLSYSAGLGKGDGFPVSAADGLKNEFREADDCLYMLSATAFSAFNSSGYKIFGRSHGYSEPSFALSRSRAVVFDRGGTGFRIENKNSTLYEGKLTNSIITAAVGDRGNFAVASKSDGYMSEIKVYSKRFEVDYTRYIANHLVSSLAVSPNGKNIAAAVFGAEKGTPVSILYSLDDNNQPVFERKYQDETIYYLSYDGESGNIIAVSDKTVRIIDKAGKVLSEYSEDGYKSALISNNNRAVLMSLEGTAQNRVIFWNAAGKSPKSFSVTGNFRDITADSEYIYLLSSDGLRQYDLSGSLKKTAETPLYAQNILKTDSGIFVSDLTGINIVKFPPKS